LPSPIVDTYALQGQSLVIHSSTSEVREGILGLLAPRPAETAPSDDQPLHCTFELAEEEDFDRALPVDPSAREEKGVDLLLGEGTYPETRFLGQGHAWWRQFRGLGRQYWDLDNAGYHAVFTPQAFRDHLPLRYLFAVIALSGFLRAKGLVPVHAGCAVVGGRGLLLSAKSGGGKSTTSLILAQGGYPLLTDERIFLQAVGGERYQAATISDVVKVSRSTLERFVPKLKPREALCEHAGDLYFKLSRSSLPFQGSTPVSALCCLHHTGRAPTTWAPLPKAAAVSGLFPVTMPLQRPEETKLVFEFLMGLLKAVPCYEVGVGTDPARAVAAFQELAAQL
jgi:hypothetical protein